MRKVISRENFKQAEYNKTDDHKATSPYITQEALFLLGLHLLTWKQRERLWEYLVLTDYGTRYIPPEKQSELLRLLTQLSEEEKLDELDFFARLKRFKELGKQILREGGPYLDLFQ